MIRADRIVADGDDMFLYRVMIADTNILKNLKKNPENRILEAQKTESFLYTTMHGTITVMKDAIHIAAFYAFKQIADEDISLLQKELKEFGETRDMRGLVLLAKEGINGTVCASAEAISQWKDLMIQKFGSMNFNDSFADEHVFPRWHVKVRKEIVSLKQDDVHPSGLHRHLTPEEFQETIINEDVVLLDTRNTYETAVGTFENAIDPSIQSFQEFSDFVSKNELPKDKKILMFCTGGIRCEKALIEMEKQGYENVYQLKGGILSYIKQFPNGKFKGECFVFDHRVSVDQALEPSKIYALCPTCGDPADQHISCEKCGKESINCVACLQDPDQKVCSKDCRYHVQRLKNQKIAA